MGKKHIRKTISTATSGFRPSQITKIGPMMVLGIIFKKTINGKNPLSKKGIEVIIKASGIAMIIPKPKPNKSVFEVKRACPVIK
tara:strand:+ start:86 stop:337 length:252 start_codon:yes stop_codon:yes gene_type:complete